MSRVIIGMDPPKRPATIEIMTGDETAVAVAGMAPMLPGTGRCWRKRIGGRNGPVSFSTVAAVTATPRRTCSCPGQGAPHRAAPG